MWLRASRLIARPASSGPAQAMGSLHETNLARLRRGMVLGTKPKPTWWTRLWAAHTSTKSTDGRSTSAETPQIGFAEREERTTVIDRL